MVVSLSSIWKFTDFREQRDLLFLQFGSYDDKLIWNNGTFIHNAISFILTNYYPFLIQKSSNWHALILYTGGVRLLFI